MKLIPKSVASMACAIILAPYAVTSSPTSPSPGLAKNDLAPVSLIHNVFRRAVTPVSTEISPILRTGAIEHLATFSSDPPLPPASGSPLPWQAGFPIYSGVANLATGNVTLTHPIVSWRTFGPGVSFALTYNSHSVSTGTLGPKWNHSYDWRITGTNPIVLTDNTGRSHTWNLVAGNYVAPTGHFETLTVLGDGRYQLKFKNQSTLIFSPAGRLSNVRDGNGNQISLGYNANGLSTVNDAYGNSLTLTYSSGRISSVTAPGNRTWSFSYNGAGRLQSVADPQIGGISPQTQFGYNSNGYLNSLTNRLGKTWNYFTGTDGNFQAVQDPDGQYAGLVYNGAITPDNGQFTAGIPDSTEPDSVNGSYPLDTVAVVYFEDASGVPGEVGLDTNGRITATRDGAGHQTNFGYGANNLRTHVYAPDGTLTQFGYDVRGNNTSVTDATNRVTTRTYDVRNNLLTETVPGNFTTTNTYDSRVNLLSTTDPSGRSKSYTYHPDGATASATDGAGNVTTFGYDSARNLNQITDPLGNVTSFAFTLDRVVSRTDARGRTTNYSYDAWGRRTVTDYPTSNDVNLTYDLESRLIQSIDGTGTRTYTYDNLGRRTAQTDPRGNTIATYDDAGRLTTQTDVTGRLVQYGFNNRGLAASVSDPTSSASYIYDSNGRVRTVSYSNGIVSTTTYDAAGRVLTLTHRRNPGNVLVVSFTNVYDAAGRLSSVTESPSGSVTTYTYDAAGRLLTENRTGVAPYASTYTYNSRGLRATAFRSEGGVTSHNGTYTYDNAGRLTTITQPGQPTENYTWNADSTLATLPGNGGIRTLEYDEEGRNTAIRYGSVTKFEFGYGFDGGRRWTKDIAANQWTWYPCGVACSAGELVELTSNLAGTTWTISSTNLTQGGCGSSLIRSGTQFVATDAYDHVSTLTDGAGTTVATAVFDRLGVQRSGTGVLSAGVTRQVYGGGNEDDKLSFIAGRLGDSTNQRTSDKVTLSGPKWPWDPCGFGEWFRQGFCHPVEDVWCIRTCLQRGKKYVGCVKPRFSCQVHCVCVRLGRF